MHINIKVNYFRTKRDLIDLWTWFYELILTNNSEKTLVFGWTQFCSIAQKTITGLYLLTMLCNCG